MNRIFLVNLKNKKKGKFYLKIGSTNSKEMKVSRNVTGYERDESDSNKEKNLHG